MASEEGGQRRIAEARVKTGNFIARLMMAYAGFAAFCVFALLSPDRLMIDAQASLNMPFAGTVSFLAFMVVAPVVLIGMRVYLEVYVQRWRQLDAKLDPETEPKTISPLKHPLLRIFSWFVLYFLLPALLGLFTWKALAKEDWGDAFLFLTLVCAMAQVSQFIRWPWFLRAVLVAVISGSLLVVGFFAGGMLHRGLNLSHEDLKWAYLVGEDLRYAWLIEADLSNTDLRNADLTHADLRSANLTGANLFRANLTGAWLSDADLTDAYLFAADLTFADLPGANLTGANLQGANLTDADFSFADLTDADLTFADLPRANLTGADLTGAIVDQRQLDIACIWKDYSPPTLPGGLTPPQNFCEPRAQ